MTSSLNRVNEILAFGKLRWLPADGRSSLICAIESASGAMPGLGGAIALILNTCKIKQER